MLDRDCGGNDVFRHTGFRLDGVLEGGAEGGANQASARFQFFGDCPGEDGVYT